MSHRFALILCVAGMAGVLTAPARAQQAGADPKLEQEIEAVLNGWLDAYNRGDGKAASAFFLPTAPAINPNGIVRNGPEYVNRIELQHQQNFNTTAKIDQVQAVGSDAAYALGPWSSTFGPNSGGRAGGMWLQVYERRADGWKISASSFNRIGGPGGNAGGNAGANAARGGPAANPQGGRQRP
jgi:ketosteroid isomerase-like protein